MQSKVEQKKNSYSDAIARMNSLFETYIGTLPMQGLENAFFRAAYGMANMPQIQNRRIKGISALPCDYTKEQIGEFLREPYSHERQLRQTSEILKWTAYPYFKIIKTYADIPTYRYYIAPTNFDADKETDFFREASLLNKFCKTFRPDVLGHEAVGKAATLGKVFYTYRYEIDKTHNSVKSAFWQQIPSEWTWVIGKNNISGWTISFDMMYFLQPGTDYRAFGDLFVPFLEDFNGIFEEPHGKDGRVIYSSTDTVMCKGKKIRIYPENLKKNAVGSPNMFMQNGRWFYYVSLPVDRVFGFELDDTTPNVASPFSGLMLTYSQQSDYEAAQLSLLLNPLIKIFTGTIPMLDDTVKDEDRYKVSLPARMMFESFFNMLMSNNNTGGASFFSAPFSDIKSHDFSAAANANEISESFNRYGMEKAGLAALIPATDDVKAAQVGASTAIESRFSTATVYPQIERLMQTIFRSMNLKYDWDFKMLGTIFDEETLRERAEKAFALGDTTALYILSALNGESWIDKLSRQKAVNAYGILDNFIVPQTAYTQTSEGGRPKTKEMTDEKEKAIDAGNAE